MSAAIMTHEPPVRRVVVEPTQLDLWSRPEQRLRRMTIGELAPWVARRGSTFAMDTQATIRAIHVAQRRLPRRYVCWPLLGDTGGRPPGGSRFTGTGPQRRRLLREES